ncbi:hypothetical protein BV20DRAFT_203054 [Pilatotrama ljubarskyi]|nr:hypothetical protein BV20DRAFT_203054 [Pilatotrama ljubarskyi]
MCHYFVCKHMIILIRRSLFVRIVSRRWKLEEAGICCCSFACLSIIYGTCLAYCYALDPFVVLCLPTPHPAARLVASSPLSPLPTRHSASTKFHGLRPS